MKANAEKNYRYTHQRSAIASILRFVKHVSKFFHGIHGVCCWLDILVGLNTACDCGQDGGHVAYSDGAKDRIVATDAQVLSADARNGRTPESNLRHDTDEAIVRKSKSSTGSIVDVLHGCHEVGMCAFTASRDDISSP